MCVIVRGPSGGDEGVAEAVGGDGFDDAGGVAEAGKRYHVRNLKLKIGDPDRKGRRSIDIGPAGMVFGGCNLAIRVDAEHWPAVEPHVYPLNPSGSFVILAAPAGASKSPVRRTHNASGSRRRTNRQLWTHHTGQRN